MFDLKLTKGTSGTLIGTFTLTPEQVEAVKAGRFYIQVHSESAPDGNLLGWLLPGSGRVGPSPTFAVLRCQ